MGIQIENNLVSDVKTIKQTITILFDAMRKGDGILLRSVFAEDMTLQSISSDKEGRSVLKTEKVENFSKIIGSPHTVAYNERIAFDDIKIESGLASVWAPYKFYLYGKLNHCGVDVFHLMKTGGDWKIVHIIDTRRKYDCF